MQLLRIILIAVMSAFSAAALPAQQSSGPPNALQGFSQNRNQPVHIEASTLEVRDKDKVATFTGNVRVKQGDTNMRSNTLMVFYEQDKDQNQKGENVTRSLNAETPGPGGSQKIKRLEARGGVIVTQKDQTATADLGIFDMKANTVALTGNVIMTQGKNVLRGDKLIVDLTTGVSRVESGKNGNGRVQALILPSSGGRDLKPGGAQTPLAPIH